MPKIDIILYPFEEQCDVAGCLNRKKYAITAHDGPPGLYFGICEECLHGIFDAAVENPFLYEKLRKKIADIESVEQEEQESEPEESEEEGSRLNSEAVCPICGKSFNSGAQLRGHMLTCRKHKEE